MKTVTVDIPKIVSQVKIDRGIKALERLGVYSELKENKRELIVVFPEEKTEELTLKLAFQLGMILSVEFCRL